MPKAAYADSAPLTRRNSRPLVAGKSRGVTHIMCRIMQRCCLNVPGQGDHRHTQNRCKQSGGKAAARQCACLGQCCHLWSPHRHTRRHCTVSGAWQVSWLTGRCLCPPSLTACGQVAIWAQALRLQSRGRLPIGALRPARNSLLGSTPQSRGADGNTKPRLCRTLPCAAQG